MNAISLISEENVLALISMPSSTEIRVNSCSRIGKEAYSAGTLTVSIRRQIIYNDPICAMMLNKAI